MSRVLVRCATSTAVLLCLELAGTGVGRVLGGQLKAGCRGLMACRYERFTDICTSFVVRRAGREAWASSCVPLWACSGAHGMRRSGTLSGWIPMTKEAWGAPNVNLTERVAGKSRP